MTPLPILYSFRRCPYAIRARLALGHAGVQVELREVRLRDKPPALLAVSPRGTVPVLELGDGRVLTESLHIMSWALSHGAAQDRLPGDDAERTAIERNDGPFKRLLDGYKYPERHPGSTAQDHRARAIDCHLAPLDDSLSGQAFLHGDRPGLSDWAIAPFVRQFAQVDATWFAGAPLPSLRRWLSAVLTSPLFVAVMHDRPAPWRPGDATTLLL